MLSKPTSDLGIVFFGTTGTANELQQEAAAAGDPSQYKHISVAHPLSKPGLNMLRTLQHGESCKAASFVRYSVPFF